MSYSNRVWICPYYLSDRRDRMCCEAGEVKLPDRIATLDYMERYCSSYDWEDCTLAQALGGFYEREQKGQEGNA